VNQWQGIYSYSNLFKYNEVYIKSFTFYSKTVKTGAEFRIYNTWNGELLKTITANLVVGFNEVAVNYSVPNNPVYFTRFFLCYDGALLDSIESYSQYKGEGWMMGSPSCFESPQFYSSYYTMMQGASSVDTSADPTQNTLATGSNTYGLTLNYSVRCSLASYICSIRELFKNAWIKLLAYEILQERLTSPRLNFITVSDLDETKAQRDNFYSDFEESLTDVFENLQVPYDECFDCNTQVQHTYSRP
jgi:hypothetical protein